MKVYPTKTLVINEVANGFTVSVKGSREEQEDRMDGVYVFESASGLSDFIVAHFGLKDPDAYAEFLHQEASVVIARERPLGTL